MDAPIRSLSGAAPARVIRTLNGVAVIATVKSRCLRCGVEFRGFVTTMCPHCERMTEKEVGRKAERDARRARSAAVKRRPEG
jgi:hypothetical protein